MPRFILEKTLKRLSENPHYAEMRHGDVILHVNDITDRHAASVRRHGAAFLSFPRAGTGMLDRIITHT